MIDDVSKMRKKGLGKGMMVSAMISRAFGFGGPVITAEQLLEINQR